MTLEPAYAMPHTLSRQLVPFAGTIDAIGGIVSDEGLARVLKTLASPNARKILTNGDYEAVASVPVGTMYAFVSNKNINSVPDFAGKKISVPNGEPQAHKLANLVGASPVSISLATFSANLTTGT